MRSSYQPHMSRASSSRLSAAPADEFHSYIPSFVNIGFLIQCMESNKFTAFMYHEPKKALFILGCSSLLVAGIMQAPLATITGVALGLGLCITQHCPIEVGIGVALLTATAIISPMNALLAYCLMTTLPSVQAFFSPSPAGFSFPHHSYDDNVAVRPESIGRGFGPGRW